MSRRRHQLTSQDALKYNEKPFLFCVSSLLQCFRVRIRAQIFRPDLGKMRFHPLLYLVVHLPINANILTSHVLVFIRQNILNSSLSRGKSSEANLWYKLYDFQSATFLSNISSFFCLKLCYVSYYVL